VCILDWFGKYEAVAVWIEGLALVGIFGFDIWVARRDHKETLQQVKLAQDQIKISQNAERAWVLTELDWPDDSLTKIFTGTSKIRDEPEVETTEVILQLFCRNEGKSPAWVDKIQGYSEIVEGKLRDLPSPSGHQAQQFLPIGPIAPGKEEHRNLHLTCLGHLERTQSLSIFVVVEYRDIFEHRRVTTCGYTVSGSYGAYLSRQDQLPERNRNT